MGNLRGTCGEIKMPLCCRFERINRFPARHGFFLDHVTHMQREDGLREGCGIDFHGLQDCRTVDLSTGFRDQSQEPLLQSVEHSLADIELQSMAVGVGRVARSDSDLRSGSGSHTVRRNRRVGRGADRQRIKNG